MNNTLENVDFQVNIKLNNSEAIFSYTVSYLLALLSPISTHKNHAPKTSAIK